MDNNNLDEFLSKKNKIAVVGASENKEKWGYKVFITLKKEGYDVYPINPKHETIEGYKCYPSIEALPFIPNLIITVVPPKITEMIVEQAYKKGVKKIWMQPGSESEKAIELCKNYDIKEVHQMCFVADGLNIEFKI